MPAKLLRHLLRPTLFKRVLGVQMAMVLVLLGLYVASGLTAIYARGEGPLDGDLKLVSEALARMAALVPTPDGVRRASHDVLSMVRKTADPGIAPAEMVWQVWTRDGRLLARSAEQPPLPGLPPGTLATDGRTVRDGWWLIGAHSPDGMVFVAYGQSAAYMDRVRTRLMRDTAISALVLLGIVSTTLWAATAYGLRPLNRFAQTIAARRTEDLEPLANPAHRELMPIAGAMNTLLARVRARRDSERRFFADAAHELRTPLAVINAQAHALACETGEAGSAPHRALEGGVARAADVLDKLLLLARLDGELPAAKPGTCDAGALARAALARAAPRAWQRGGECALAAEGSFPVRADPDLLEAAFDNLLDNALRYTPPEAEIAMAVARVGTRIRVDVEDSGPGLEASERERVFGRFERGTQSSGVPGSGLGLAIVQRAAALCGGSVEAGVSSTLGGARFTLWLPAAEEA